MKVSEGSALTTNQFMQDILNKEQDPNFKGDMEGLIRPGVEYDQEAAFEWVKNELIEKLK